MFFLRKTLGAATALISVGLAAGIGVAAAYAETLTVPEYEIETGAGELSFMLLTDIHNHEDAFADGTSITSYVRQYNPDFLFLAGDLIDSHTTSFDFLLPLLDLAGEEGIPVYYIHGNHESMLPDDGASFDAYMSLHGAQNIEGKTVVCGDYTFSGVREPLMDGNFEEAIEDSLEELEGTYDKSLYNIVLCHQPRPTMLLSQAGFDLALSGHYHGGQGAFGDAPIFSSNEYWHGQYTRGSFNHIVSSGVGTSFYLPVRMGMPAEIPYVKLS